MQESFREGPTSCPSCILWVDLFVCIYFHLLSISGDNYKGYIASRLKDGYELIPIVLLNLFSYILYIYTYITNKNILRKKEMRCRDYD